MKKFLLLSKALMLVCLLFGTSVFSQVGIGTTNPELSSVLDISSTTQGMLFPRMTTAQRVAISAPANGLTVYDITLNAIYYYKTSDASWNELSSARSRTNYKLIKSTDVLATVLATELTAGGGTKYKLDSSTYYEINGTIAVDRPIDLNGAYVEGLHANQDKLVRASGNLFEGDTGGTVKVLTLVASGGGGKVFNIDCTSNVVPQSFLVRDCIIASSASVGLVKGLNLVFFNVINFSGNTTGIRFENISNLLLSSMAWFGNNSGTYETYVGTFSLIDKISGFMDVNSGKTGVDVSANPTITGNAYMSDIVFYSSASLGTYVNPYTVGTYTGYSFNDKWRVVCGGIPNEGDSFATGTLYLNRTLTAPTLSAIATTGNTKVPGTTVATNFHRISSTAFNRLVYSGLKTRQFAVSASVSFDAGGGGASDYLFYFVKYNATGSTATVLTGTETYIDTNSGNVQSFPVTGTVTLSTGEYVELCVQRVSGGSKTLTFKSYNMSLK
ncbi:MAG: hypothetical protein V4572_06495 [Bacteroidota bacterium]